MKLIQILVKFMEAGILFYMLQNLVPPRQTQDVTTLHVDVYLAAGAIYIYENACLLKCQDMRKPS
jgi:hypothetical protein